MSQLNLLFSALFIVQEKARKIMALKAVEPLIEGKYKGPKGTVEGAASAAVESILHEQPYKQAELEEALGASLSSLFEGNNSQQKSVAFANSHGEQLSSFLYTSMLD